MVGDGGISKLQKLGGVSLNGTDFNSLGGADLIGVIQDNDFLKNR